MKNWKADFYICFKVHIGPTDHAKKVWKKWGAHGFFGLGVKSEEILTRQFWGWKKAKIKFFFFTQFIVTLCQKDGLNMNFLSDLPFRLQDVLCKRHWNSSFQPQNWDRPPQHCVSPQIPTFGLRYITWMGTFANATKHALPPKSGFPNIGPLNHQYS